MKKRLLILIVAVMSLCFALAGCGSDDDFIDKDSAVKVVFNLEGGQYQNSPAPIVYYYAFKKGTENLIKNPAAEDEKDKFNSSEVKRPDYDFVGWYRSKEEAEEGSADSDNKWDFANDRVTDDGVVLYAGWARVVRYYYCLYYIDEQSGEEVRRGNRYTVNEGDKFEDKRGYADKRSGYTKVGFFQDPECTQPWNDDFTHPGGENRTEIKVYVKYEQGDFVEVRTASELVRNKTSDIRLMNDIDMSELTESEINSFANSFKNYGKILDGNGFAIKNLTMTYVVDDNNLIGSNELDDSGDRYILGISLFGRGTGATVRNVRFENVTVDIDVTYRNVQRIVFAPLFLKANRATVTNVHFDGTVVISRVNQNITNNPDKLEVITDRGYFMKDDDSLFQDVDISVTIDNQIA